MFYPQKKKTEGVLCKINFSFWIRERRHLTGSECLTVRYGDRTALAPLAVALGFSGPKTAARVLTSVMDHQFIINPTKIRDKSLE